MGNFIIVLFLLGCLLDTFAGLIWWSGLLQQKEYRLDRLVAHIRSLTGRQILLHVLPSLTIFRLKTFKRPKRTLRVGILLLGSVVVLFLLVFSLAYWVVAVPAIATIRLIVLAIGVYIFAPVVLLLFTALTGGLVSLVTTYYLFLVRQRIKKQQPFIIGITGSYGKTTTKQLLSHVLQQRGKVCTTPGSINTALGVARYVYKHLGCSKILVLEYAAYRVGEIARLASVAPPDMAILTGLGKQHLELFGSKQLIAEAKAELLASLPQGAAVFCANQSAMQIVAAAKNICALEIVETWRNSSPKLQSKIVGDHYQDSIKAVIAAAQYLKLSDKQIVARLESFVPGDKWIQRKTAKSGATILDDFGTSNPDGFSAALRLLAQQSESRKILITTGIVDLGRESVAIHSQLAQQAAVVVGEVWYLGEAGKTVFQQVFSDKLVSTQADVRKKIQLLDKNTVLLLEGRMPQWLTEHL
ncbi:MAG: hypothetical protein GW946_01830 [Candidatus Pacebacteria bacterium]|nr:hypothetical protein [Candidatus Paceibacterota bacterium]